MAGREGQEEHPRQRLQRPEAGEDAAHSRNGVDKEGIRVLMGCWRDRAGAQGFETSLIVLCFILTMMENFQRIRGRGML